MPSPVRRSPIIARDSSQELQYRPTLDGWTPDKVKRASASADAGDLQSLADLCEALMADDRIDGVTATRTHGLLGLPLSFVSGNDEARKLLETHDKAPGEWWHMHSESELVQLMAWGLILGVGLAQRIPLPRLAGQVQRYRLETWSPRCLQYTFDPKRGDSHWSVQTAKGLEKIVPGAGKWVLFTPYGVKRPWAKGKWQALAFPWLLKRFSLEDRANHGQTLGNPITLGKAPKGATERQRNKFLAQLVGMGKQGKLVLPDGWDLVLREAAGRTWEIYSDSVSWADAAITIVLAGQVVTTEGSPGFNSGNVQERIVGDLIRFDAERLSTCLQEQSLYPWVLENWQDSNPPWPYWNTERPPDRMVQAQTWESTGRAIEQANAVLSAGGFQVDAVTVYKDLGIPLLAVPKGESKPQPVQLAPTDLAKAFTLNEVRLMNGSPKLLKPDGSPDPRGDLLMSEAAIAIAGPEDPRAKPTQGPQNEPEKVPDLPQGS